MMHPRIRSTSVPALVTALATLTSPAWAVDPTASLYSVSLTTPVSVAAEGSTPGEFVLSRNGSSGALTVNLTLAASNTADVSNDTVSGDFYFMLPGGSTPLTVTNGSFSVTIPDGVSRQRIFVYARRDFTMEGSELAQLDLGLSPTYIRGASLSGTITVADADIIASLSTPDVLAHEYWLSSSVTATFRINYNNWIASKLFTTVTSGSAKLNTDYVGGLMPIHYPSGGNILTLETNTSASVVFVNSAGSRFTYDLRGSGWYVNDAPTVSFSYPTKGAQSVSELLMTDGGSGYDAEDPPVFILTPSTTYGQPATFLGDVDATDGSLRGVYILDAGVYQCDLASGVVTGSEISSATLTQTGGVNPAGTDAQFTTITVETAKGSRATGKAVLNGIVTSIPLPAGHVWSSITTVAITGGGGKGATAEIVVGTPSYVRITNPGSGFTSRPDVVLTDDTFTATATANIAGPVLVNVTNNGLGYVAAPTLTFGVVTPPAALTTADGAGVYDNDNSTINQVFTVANQSNFSADMQSLITMPEARFLRSDGEGFPHEDWKVITKESDRGVNKKGSNLVEVNPGNGLIYVGDAIRFASDLALNPVPYYIVEAIELPVDSDRSETDDEKTDFSYILHLSNGLTSDKTDGDKVQNLFIQDQNRVDTALPGRFSDVVGYPQFDYLVDPLNDSAVEGAEKVNLNIVANPSFTMREPTMAEVVIADDDAIADIVTVSQASEPALSGKMRITLSAALPVNTTLIYQVSGSATPGNSQDLTPADPDYVLLGLTDMQAPTSGNRDAYAIGSITIPAGATSADIEIATLDDALSEGPETVTITLQQSLDLLLSGSSSSQVNPSATVNITDKVGTVGLVATTSPVMPVDGDEGTGANSTSPAQFTIRLTAPSAVNPTPPPLGIGFRLGGTATYGADYILNMPVGSGITLDTVSMIGSVVIDADGAGHVLTGGNNINTATLTLTVFNDALIEQDETITLTLLSGSGYSLEANSVQDVKIKDDLPAITLQGISNGNESGGVPAVFQISYAGGIRSRDIVVKYGLDTSSSAFASAPDVVSVAGTVTIPSGQSSTLVSLLVVDDSIVEGTEELWLQISADPAYQISVGRAKVDILDNEPTVSIAAAATSVLENGSPVAIRVYLSAAQSRDLSVPITVSGTATSGQDYVAIPTAVTILAGQVTKDITVTPRTDTRSESTETLVVTLTASTAYSLGTPSSATVNIIDVNGGSTTPDTSGVPSGSVADSGGGGGGGGCGAGGGLALLAAAALALQRRRKG